MSQTTEMMEGAAIRRRFGRILLRSMEGRERLDVTTTRLRGGRSSVNDLVVDHASVSNAHFEIVLDDRGVRLRDLDSTNGTWVGDLRIRECWLEPGVVFRAGGRSFELLEADRIEVPISALARFEDLIGESPVMREVFALLERIADREIDVLLGGETGTGKELAARGLHARSSRNTGPFVVLDCASLPRELAEATILGHRKGAFTGAIADRPGCFEDADTGTLFLDEIGELPLELQPKLLRVLDRREVQRVGETRTRSVSVRVVAATHRDLRKMVADGHFREDLYYRLAEISVDLPPLREREEDVIRLAERFLEEIGHDGGAELALSDEAASTLMDHAWPGNVRELRKVIKRAAVLSTSETVQREDLALVGRRPAEAGTSELFDLPFKEAREEFERAYFSRLLRRTGGNVSEAARRASYSRQGVGDLLRRLGLRTDGDP